MAGPAAADSDILEESDGVVVAGTLIKFRSTAPEGKICPAAQGKAVHKAYRKG
jgi:hypothetical protein